MKHTVTTNFINSETVLTNTFNSPHSAAAFAEEQCTHDEVKTSVVTRDKDGVMLNVFTGHNVDSWLSVEHKIRDERTSFELSFHKTSEGVHEMLQIKTKNSFTIVSGENLKKLKAMLNQ